MTLTYPFDFSPTEDFSDYRRDQAGIPMVYYPHIQHWEYNPITISQYGLSHLASFDRTRNDEAARMAITMADWLVANLETWKSDIGAWVFHFDMWFYGPANPWISALAQAQGLSLLLRCCELGNRLAYEETSRRAVRAFYHPMAEGGVARQFPDGSLAFEEYPTVEPSLVLNGMLFALLGLRDYADYFADARAQELYELGLSGVKNNLARYDTGFWNHYDLHRSRRLASPDYVRIHVQLLNVFAGLTGDEYFARTARKWQGYLDSMSCQLRFYAVKGIEKIRLRLNDYSLTS